MIGFGFHSFLRSSLSSFVCQSLQKRLLSLVQREKEFFGRWFDVATSTFKSTVGPRQVMMITLNSVVFTKLLKIEIIIIDHIKLLIIRTTRIIACNEPLNHLMVLAL